MNIKNGLIFCLFEFVFMFCSVSHPPLRLFFLFPLSFSSLLILLSLRSRIFFLVLSSPHFINFLSCPFYLFSPIDFPCFRSSISSFSLLLPSPAFNIPFSSLLLLSLPSSLSLSLHHFTYHFFILYSLILPSSSILFPSFLSIFLSPFWLP